MNRREALAAIVSAPALAYLPDAPTARAKPKPRQYVVEWVKYTIADGVAITEARIRHATGWFVSKVHGNTIRLDDDVLLIAGPQGFTFQVESDRSAELLIGGWMLDTRDVPK